jgi:hypothetical protein
LLAEENGIHNISLSFHKESEGKDLEFLELCKTKGVKIWTCFYVIDDLKQIDEALELFKSYKDVVNNFRIKVASNLGVEDKADNKIFVSDVIKYLFALGKTEFQNANQKVSYAQVIHDGLDIKVISWYDVKNIDLRDIDCQPYYRANNSTVNNLVTTQLINEGIEKKRLNVRRVYPYDITKCADLWVDMAKEENSSYEPDKESWCSQMYDFIKSKQNHIWVGEVNGETVGFFSGSVNYSPLYTDNYLLGLCFYVKPEFRKTPISKKLHNAYKAIGERFNAHRVIRQVTKEHSKVLLNKGQDITHFIIEEHI